MVMFMHLATLKDSLASWYASLGPDPGPQDYWYAAAKQPTY